MSNIGDLVTTLSCDASNYSQGPDKAIASNKALSGSIDSIIGQLQRQKREFDKQGKTTQDNILGAAAKGATEGQVNSALQLNEEVEALKNKAAAERDAMAAQQQAQAAKNASAAAGAALLASLRDEAATLGMTSDELRIYRAELAGVNPVTIAAARAAQTNIAAIIAQANATEEAANKAATARQAGETLVANLKQQQATLGMTSAEVRIYNATLAGASDADIRAAKSIQHQIDQRQRLDQQLQQSTGVLGTHRAGTMVLTESVRGLEDAVAGFSNNGLKGMLQATTNNITQIGALAGGTAGLALSLGAIAALVGVSLLPKLYEWYTGTENQEKATKRLDEENERFYQREVQRITSLAELTKNQIDAGRDTSRMSDRIGRQDSNSNELRSLKDAAEDKRAAAAKEDANALAALGKRQSILKSNPGLDSGKNGQGERWRREKMSEKDRKAAEEKDKKPAEELVRLDMELKASIARRNLLNQQAADTEKAALKQAALDKQKLRNETNAAEQAEQQKESQEFLEREKRRAAGAEQIRKNSASIIEEMIRKKSPAAADEIDRQQKIKEQKSSIAKAANSGLITKDEALLANKAIEQRPTVLPGGPTAAVQSGSTAAYSAMLKALNNKRDQDYQKQVVEETKALGVTLEKIEAKNPVEVTTMTI